jgi:hypothetical protein
MAYILLIVEPTGQRRQRTLKEGHQAYDTMTAFAERLQERGVLLGANSLASETEAVRIERRGGRERMVDGPYAEAKEMVGGYFLLNCATREEALAIAAECPAAEWCSVEVRRVAPCFE